MKIYDYIHKPVGKTEEELARLNILSNDYDLKTKNNIFVVRDESTNKFIAFPNVQAYLSHLAGVPVASRTFHEAIMCATTPQKIRIDLDISHADAQALGLTRADDEIELVNDVEEAIISTFMSLYYTKIDVDIKHSDIITCTSTGFDNIKGEIKYSYHFIVDNFAAPINIDIRTFLRKFIEIIPPQYAKFVDMSVCKSLQFFRLLDCQKPNSGRIKRIFRARDGISSTATFLTQVDGCVMLPQLHIAAAEKAREELIPEKIAALIASIPDSEYDKGFKFARIIDSLILFNRTAPSHCKICKRQHDADNTMYWRISGDQLLQYCRHDDSGEAITLLRGKQVAECIKTQSEKWPEEQIKKTLIATIKDKSVEITKFDNLPAAQKHIYEEPAMREFEIKQILAIKAQMKMGKTKQLIEYIERYFGGDNARIVTVSFRQSFTTEMARKLPKFASYLNIAGQIDLGQVPRVIVQAESLHRLQINESVDLLILDECESILEQFDSGNFKYFNKSFGVFQWLMRHSRNCILMDANLCNRTFNMIERFRGQEALGQVFYHKNNFKRAAEDTFLFTSNKYNWLAYLLDKLADGERVCIPSNSLAAAETLEAVIRRRYPQLRVMCYSSKTLQSIKKRDFGDINKTWLEFDVLIYTPTISAGLSFEQEHFDYIFGYFTTSSCPVETCRQMIARIRNVKARKYYICIANYNVRTLPETPEGVQDVLYKSRESLFGDIDLENLQFTIDLKGNRIFYQSDYFCLWLENQCIKNKSINNFARRLIRQIAETGATLKQLAMQSAGILEQIRQEYQSTDETLKDEWNGRVALSPEIDEEENRKIMQKNEQQLDVTLDEMASHEKFIMRRTYKIDDGGTIDKEFVESYNDRKVMEKFRNITAITHARSVSEALTDIQTAEREYFATQMLGECDLEAEAAAKTSQRERNEFSDLNHKYKFDLHLNLVYAVAICGFKKISDLSTAIPQAVMIAAINANRGRLMQIIDSCLPQLQLRRPDAEKLAKAENILAVLNSMLGEFYGIHISKTRKNGGTYKLVWPDCFQYSYMGAMYDGKSWAQPLAGDKIKNKPTIMVYINELEHQEIVKV